MGKTKVAVVGETTPEEEKKKKEKQEAKKAAREAEKKAAKETAKDVASEDSEPVEVNKTKGDDTSGVKSKYAAKKGEPQKKQKSPRYKNSAKEIDKGGKYPLDKAVSLLKKFEPAKFDETVELHVNTREKGVNGSIDLPHGTGKKLRIKIADDAIIEDIQKGKIDFDVLVAKPEMMPKLAKVARVLGPRGLMPNPKAGTVTESPEKVVDKLSKGSVNFKTEPKAPIIHLSIGKKSFDEAKLKENAKAAITSIGKNKIKTATLTSTMNPGITLDIESVATK